MLGSNVKQFDVLSGAATLLEQTQRTIKVDWNSHFGEILPNRVFDDCPNANLDLRVLKEGKFLSPFKFLDFTIIFNLFVKHQLLRFLPLRPHQGRDKDVMSALKDLL